MTHAKAPVGMGWVLVTLLTGCASEPPDYRKMLQNNPVVLQGASFGPGKSGGWSPRQQTIRVEGRYALYAVPQQTVEKGKAAVATIRARAELKEGDLVRFWYADENTDWWRGNSGTDLMSSAGSQQVHLGPGEVRTDYYWAMEAYWDAWWIEWWRTKPERDFNDFLLGIIRLAPVAPI